jgi:hypothetical protein
MCSTVGQCSLAGVKLVPGLCTIAPEHGMSVRGVSWQPDGIRAPQSSVRAMSPVLKQCAHAAHRDILNAARLVAEKVERGGYAAGYDWCCSQLRGCGLARLANEVELAKASRHLAGMDFGAAISVYKARGAAGPLWPAGLLPACSHKVPHTYNHTTSGLACTLHGPVQTSAAAFIGKGTSTDPH